MYHCFGWYDVGNCFMHWWSHRDRELLEREAKKLFADYEITAR